MYIGEEMNFIFSTKYTYIYIYTWKEEIGSIFMLIFPRKIYFIARERERQRGRYCFIKIYTYR